MTANILLVDDAEETASLVRFALSQNSEIQLKIATSFHDAIDCLQASRFDLVLLDIGLPDGDGISLFSQLKSLPFYKETPVIFLTARGDLSTRIAAFELDADDFIAKPFNLAELKVRVESRLRRLRQVRHVSDEYSIGPFVFELGAHRVFNKIENSYLDLTSREFKILLHLARHPAWIFGRRQLINAVWPEGVHISERAIDTHICIVRRKLGAYAHFIESVPCEGYRFQARDQKPMQKPLQKSAQTHQQGSGRRDASLLNGTQAVKEEYLPISSNH